MWKGVFEGKGRKKKRGGGRVVVGRASVAGLSLTVPGAEEEWERLIDIKQNPPTTTKDSGEEDGD